MLAIISPAKIMQTKRLHTQQSCGFTEPRFDAQAEYIASIMTQYSAWELSEILKISQPIARELKGRFMDFHDPDVGMIPAIDGYNGVVYKHIKGEEDFTSQQLDYLQARVRITSLLYGLLRPLDLIKPYRMEGFVRLSHSDMRVDRFWRDVQTQRLIEDVRESGGVLLYLASKEEQQALHWREVLESVRVIDFLFLQPKGDRLRQVVVYTKMARGEMIRYMMERNIDDPEELKSFEWCGYRYRDDLSTSDSWVWVMD